MPKIEIATVGVNLNFCHCWKRINPTKIKLFIFHFTFKIRIHHQNRSTCKTLHKLINRGIFYPALSGFLFCVLAEFWEDLVLPQILVVFKSPNMKIDFVDFLQIGAAFWKKQITPRLVTYSYLWTKYERNLMFDRGRKWLLDVSQTFTLFLNKKNAITGASRLACLEIRSRNEEAKQDLLAKGSLLSTLSTSILFTCFWIDLVRVLATTGNTSAVALNRVYKYTKIQRPRFQRNYIITRDQQSNLHGTSFQSSPKTNRMLITRTICIQWMFTTPDHC